MALSITVNGGGTFSASMEEGPVSFTATLGAVPGPKGDTGATGPAGVVSATAPITYDSGTQTIGISATPTFTSITATTVNATNVAFADATTQTTAFVGEARKEYVIARNNTGSTIASGKVVYLSGATGNKPTIALALADSEATSARTIGITVESIANNADGKVVISGAAENIDTSAFSAGDTLYLSATTAGAMTTTLPAAPLHGVVIGIVTRANPSVGSIEVAINNYQELKELSDVNVSDRANNDGLFWEASSTTWRSKTIAEVLGYTPADNASLASYAPLASPTFTGTVTIPAGANITGYLTTATAASTYAPLASPTFTGDPKAPTPATSDNDTSVATTAFVNAYCPTASTTTAGKVELATSIETTAGTDTSRAVTPDTLVDAMASGNFSRFIGITYDTATNGTGGLNAASAGGFGRNLWGPTSTGAGHVRAGMRVVNQRALGGTNHLDFTKRVELYATITRAAASPSNDSIYRVVLGEAQTINTGDPTVRSIGIKVTGSGAMQILAHDGTTLTTYTTSHTPAINATFDLKLVSNASGTVEAFVNGSSVGSTSGGPTTRGSGTNTESYLNMRIENLSTFTSGRQQYETFPSVHIAF